LAALLDKAVISDIENDDEVSRRQIEYWLYCEDELPDPATDPKEWLLEAIDAEPGRWTAELCRLKHDVPSDNQGIAYCGLCQEYANPRKRARSKALGPALPGFGRGAYKLHPACSKQGLTWLRKTLSRLAKNGLITKIQNARIPDIRQARSWDFGTRIYPRKGQDNDQNE
jgi:hypothetical protein